MKTTLTRLEKKGDGIRATLSTGEKVDTDVVLFAIGRHPNTEGLGLDKAGVKLDSAGAVIVDEVFAELRGERLRHRRCDQSHQPHARGHSRWPCLRRHGLQQAAPRPWTMPTIPSAVFGRPPIGCVGLTENRRAPQPKQRSTSTAPISGPCAPRSRAMKHEP